MEAALLLTALCRAVLTTPTRPSEADFDNARKQEIDQIIEEKEQHVKLPDTESGKRAIEVARKTVRSEKALLESPTKGPVLKPETIMSVHFRIVSPQEIHVLCQTRNRRKFGVFAEFRDCNAMTWRETRALSAAISVFRPGSALSPQAFMDRVEQLLVEFPKSPVGAYDTRLFVKLRPDVAEQTQGPLTEDRIVSTSIAFDDDETICVSAITGRHRFTVRLYTVLENQQISLASCLALQDVLRCLEPGDSLSRIGFYFYAYQLRKYYKCGMMTIADRTNLEYMIVPTTVETGAPIEKVLNYVYDLYRPFEKGARIGYPGFDIKRMIRPLGKSELYSASSTTMVKEVAIQVFSAGSFSSKQARAVVRKAPHRNVVEVLDHLASPLPALVLPLPDGIFLSEYWDTGDLLKQSEAVRVCLRLASGIQSLHRQNIIVADLKSADILLTKSREPILYDLMFTNLESGGCAAEDKEDSKLGEYMLTRRSEACKWICPELFRSGPITPKSVVFAFGVVAWEVLTQRSAFPQGPGASRQEDLMSHIYHGGRPDTAKICGPASLRNLIHQCMEASPLYRPDIDIIVDILGNLSEVDEQTSEEHTLDFGKFVSFIEENLPGEIPRKLLPGCFDALKNKEKDTVQMQCVDQFVEEAKRIGTNTIVANLLHHYCEPGASRSYLDEVSLLSLEPARPLTIEEFYCALKHLPSEVIPDDQIFPLFKTLAGGTGHVDSSLLRRFSGAALEVGLDCALKML